MSDWYDQHGYPTEAALDRIQHFEGTPRELIEFISDMWWPQGTPMGTLKKEAFSIGGSGYVWRFATGGWSGNETIIGELEKTHFWYRFWESTHRGGGYVFEIDTVAMHKVDYWGDLRLMPTELGQRCPDCNHPQAYHVDVCTIGIGGGEICGCTTTVTTVEATAETPFITEVEGLKLQNVHPADNCAGEPCVIHNPSNHHMRSWQLLWRDDRGIFERVCPHGVGHPDPDQFAFWDKMEAQRTIEIAKWMSQQDPADLAMMSSWEKPGNPWSGMSIHGCDGCCVGD